VSGGMGDAPYGTDPVPYPLPNNGDNIHIVTQDPTTHIWSKAAELDLGQNTTLGIAAGHPSGNGLPVLNGTFASVNAAVFVAPCAAGVAISNDGNVLVVANYYNDSISILKSNPTTGLTKTGELDLRPGKISSANQGVPGGEYPLWVAFKGNATVYVSSIRDREIDVITLSGTPTVSARIKVAGQPNRMAMNAAQTLLFAAEDQSDSVAVVNTANNDLVTEIPVGPPSQMLNGTPNLTGNNTNSCCGANKFFSRAGYDLCTGWGSPKGSNLIHSLALPQRLVIAPSSALVFTGPVGGPLNPSALSYSLTNRTGSLDWSLALDAGDLDRRRIGGSVLVVNRGGQIIRAHSGRPCVAVRPRGGG